MKCLALPVIIGATRIVTKELNISGNNTPGKNSIDSLYIKKRNLY